MLTFIVLIIASFIADIISWSFFGTFLSLQLLATAALILFLAPQWLIIPCLIGLSIESMLISTLATPFLLYLVPATLAIHGLRSCLALPYWLSISATYFLFFILHFLVYQIPLLPSGYTFLALSANLIVLNLVLKYIIKVA